MDWIKIDHDDQSTFPEKWERIIGKKITNEGKPKYYIGRYVGIGRNKVRIKTDHTEMDIFGKEFVPIYCYATHWKKFEE